MRKILFAMTILAGAAAAAAGASASPRVLPVDPAYGHGPSAQPVYYGDAYREDWRRNEWRREEWRRHQQREVRRDWERREEWRRYHQQPYGYYQPHRGW